MFERYSTRREFLKCGNLLFLFLLNACSNSSNKEKIALQSSFYPNYFKETIPNSWQKENIIFGNKYEEKNRNIIKNTDLILINDGWTNILNIEEFEEINESPFFKKLDKRSRDFLATYDDNHRKRLYPIGVIPYAVLIKNNKDLINPALKSWNFLLSKKLNKKVIFPKSPRIILSISQKINSSYSLGKLKNQAMIFDDENALNWLMNSDALVAIVPYSLCSKYLKIDSRLSIVFPEQGVPLIWHFILSKSRKNFESIGRWIESLESKLNIDKLVRQGWYLPFINEYSQNMYKNNLPEMNFNAPSQTCWDNSWSLSNLTEVQKINFVNLWNKSLTP